MRWWWRVAGGGAVLAASAVAAGSALVLPGLEIPLPALSGSTPFAPVRSSALIALLLAVLVGAVTTTSHRAPMITASRPMRLAEAAPLALAIGMATLACIIALPLGLPAEGGWLMVRSLLGFGGLSLLLLPVTGPRYAGVPPTLHLLAAAVLGREQGTDGPRTAVWAWPIADSAGALYWLPALAAGAAGLTALLVRRGWSRREVEQALDARRG